jgi:hypothetical protein
MKKYKILCLVSIPGFASGCFQRDKGNNLSRRPNIIMIVSDDHGIDPFRCYGNLIVKTPNLDRLTGVDTCKTILHEMTEKLKEFQKTTMDPESFNGPIKY